MYNKKYTKYVCRPHLDVQNIKLQQLKFYIDTTIVYEYTIPECIQRYRILLTINNNTIFQNEYRHKK